MGVVNMTCLYKRTSASGQAERFVQEALEANPDFTCCTTINSKGEVKCERMANFTGVEKFKAECQRCREKLKVKN